MPFTYLTNQSLDDAKAAYFAALKERGFAPRTETAAIQDALGRYTAKPVYAQICAPHYHACAMDGIAVVAKDTFGATETTPVILNPGQYIVVDTGDPLPEGCDAVVMIEDVIRVQDGVKLLKSAAPWQHVRQIGEDICAGEMLLPSYSRITPASMGAMLAGGVLHVAVYARPKVGIIPTGDEVVAPTENPGPGDVMEFNSTIFSGMIRQWGGEPVTYPIVKDKLPLIIETLQKAISECDIVLLNAGSSAGRDDYSSQAIGTVGEVFCHGISIKPGKPTILGCAGKVPVLGIPGYPVSGIIVVEQLLKPLVMQLTGCPGYSDTQVKATLSRQLNSGLKYREFVRVRLGYVDDKLIASPLNRGAGVVTSFVKADAIMEIPQNSEGYDAGATVDVQLLRPLDEVKQALVVTGSHDPLIDELAELMRQRWREASVASTHVGSMGGIMAARRQEMHVGGIHLLDEATGTYNLPYLKKNFPQGGVRLVECVQRIQGLMVAKGNPKHIQTLADLQKPQMRYVNRQKGSGTRVLCDYLCRRDGIDMDQIYGYEREEFTHTAVAALVASDSADAGLGIYSAAKLYDLDFIPICLEQYDLLIPDYAWDTPMVQRLLTVLQSREFRSKLESLGGYELDQPGRVREHI